jgi:hypothetical protein
MKTRTVPLLIEKVQQVAIARNATILGVGLRTCKTSGSGLLAGEFKPELYVVEKENDEQVLRVLLTLGTDMVGPDTGVVHVGSYYIREGTFIGHVFEVIDDATMLFVNP